MGKNLKNKNLDKGITQRKDGYYVGRFISQTGERKQKIFRDYADCRAWIIDSRYEDKHCILPIPEQLTVDAWFHRWINVKEKTVKPNTVRNYRERYTANVKPAIGEMVLTDVKPVQCQEILNLMADKYRSSTITQTRTTLENMFGYAVRNDLLAKNPAGNLKSDIGLTEKRQRVLTRSEQSIFLAAIIGHRYELPFKFALQTGLRCGELNGLRWSDIDWEKRKIHIQRTMEFRN